LRPALAVPNGASTGTSQWTLKKFIGIFMDLQTPPAGVNIVPEIWGARPFSLIVAIAEAGKLK
jgi:hypothetical protein